MSQLLATGCPKAGIPFRETPPLPEAHGIYSLCFCYGTTYGDILQYRATAVLDLKQRAFAGMHDTSNARMGSVLFLVFYVSLGREASSNSF